MNRPGSNISHNRTYSLDRPMLPSVLNECKSIQQTKQHQQSKHAAANEQKLFSPDQNDCTLRAHHSVKSGSARNDCRKTSKTHREDSNTFQISNGKFKIQNPIKKFKLSVLAFPHTQEKKKDHLHVFKFKLLVLHNPPKLNSNAYASENPNAQKPRFSPDRDIIRN